MRRRIGHQASNGNNTSSTLQIQTHRWLQANENTVQGALYVYISFRCGGDSIGRSDAVFGLLCTLLFGMAAAEVAMFVEASRSCWNERGNESVPRIRVVHR